MDFEKDKKNEYWVLRSQIIVIIFFIVVSISLAQSVDSTDNGWKHSSELFIPRYHEYAE